VLGRWSLSWLRVIALGFGVWQLEFVPSWIVIQAKSLLSLTLFKFCILLLLNEIHDSDMSLKRFGANQAVGQQQAVPGEEETPVHLAVDAATAEHQGNLWRVILLIRPPWTRGISWKLG
jgi:hypothetical protein